MERKVPWWSVVLVQLSNTEVEKIDGETDEDLLKMQVEMVVKMSSNDSKRKSGQALG